MYSLLQRDIVYSGKRPNCPGLQQEDLLHGWWNKELYRRTSSCASSVCVCLHGVMNSMLQARDPQGCIFPERTPTVKRMHCGRLKSHKDLFLFLPQTEKFSSSSSSNMSSVQAKIESPEITINRQVPNSKIITTNWKRFQKTPLKCIFVHFIILVTNLTPIFQLQGSFTRIITLRQTH